MILSSNLVTRLATSTHPRGLYTLFFTEMWERFSYYGMRALLVLFMTATLANGGLGYDKVTVTLISYYSPAQAP